MSGKGSFSVTSGHRGQCICRHDEPPLGDAGADLFEAQPSSGGKQRPIWTFMRSQQFYSKLFKDLMQLTTASAVVIISSAGCPHAPLAALEGGAPEVLFVVDRLPAHQIYHTKVAFNLC